MIYLAIFACIVFLFGFVVAFGAPYVPSLRKDVRRAFTELYPLTKKDFVVDLGSGDGQVLLEAARLGARGIGYELNPLLVFISRLRVKGSAEIQLANMWSAHLPPETTVVYCFSVSRDSKRMGVFLQAEANRLGRTIHMITYGVGLKEFAASSVLNAHSLYMIHPQVKQ